MFVEALGSDFNAFTTIGCPSTFINGFGVVKQASLNLLPSPAIGIKLMTSFKTLFFLLVSVSPLQF